MSSGKKALIAVLICAAVIGAAACGWFFWLKDVIELADAAPVYVNSVSSIIGLDTGNNPRYSGIIEPQKTYGVEKDASKEVEEILVAVGDLVSEGDALFRYKTDDLELTLREAQLAQEGISNQISVLQSQKATLEKEKKTASKDEQASYTLRIQSIELQIEQEKYNSSVKDAEIQKLKEAMDNTEVFSKVEGVIKEINTNSKTDASGQPLPFISILSAGEYRVKGTVTEMNRGSLLEGQAVTVHSRIDSSLKWEGVVESIDAEPASDNNNSTYYYDSGFGGTQSSKYYFYVVLDYPEGLVLGQHVYIEPRLEENEQKKTGLWLPAFYVDHDTSGSFVWVRNEKKKLERRTVILGTYDSADNQYEIKNGLTARDYIAYPDESLREGLPTTMDAVSQIPQAPVFPQESIDEAFDIGGDNGEILTGGGMASFPEDGVGGFSEDIPAGMDEGEPPEDTDSF